MPANVSPSSHAPVIGLDPAPRFAETHVDRSSESLSDHDAMAPEYPIPRKLWGAPESREHADMEVYAQPREGSTIRSFLYVVTERWFQAID